MKIESTGECVVFAGKFPCRGHVPIDGMPKDGDLNKIPGVDWTWFEFEHALFCSIAGWLRTLIRKR